MSSTDVEIFKAWGQTLAEARASQGRDSGTLSRELMLSLAQLRGIESGNTHAFHAQSYYLRGVQRYADYLNITLDPPLDSIKVQDSATAPRARLPQRAAGIAQRQSVAHNSMALPNRRTHGVKLGRWLFLLLLILGGTGTYLAIDDGWPSRALEAWQAQNDHTDALPGHEPLQAAAEMMEAAPMAEQALATQLNTNITSRPVPAPATTAPLTPPVSHAPTPLGSVAPSPPVLAAAPTTGSTPAPIGTSANTAPLPTNTQVTPAVQPETAPTTTAAEPLSVVPNVSEPDIVLSFHEECWVEWRTNDEPTQQRIFKAGEQLRLPAQQVQRLTLGNARAVQAQVSGKPLDLLQFTRGSGTVARLDNATLLQAIR